MTEFFKSQMDYIHFFYGLSFILMAAICFALKRSGKSALPWGWLSLFAVVHGLCGWLEMLVFSFGESRPFAAVRLVVMAASFVFLLGFAQSAAAGKNQTGGFFSRRWIFLPLLALAALGGCGGINGFNASIRYALGLTGGLGASAMLYRYARCFEREQRALLSGAALGMFFYALAAGVIVPETVFPPASFLNHNSFVKVVGIPIELARGVLALSMTGFIWRYYYDVCFMALATGFLKKHEVAFSRFLTVTLIVVFTGGWLVTAGVGRLTHRGLCSRLLSHAKMAAAAVNPRRIHNLTASMTDVASPDYARLREQFSLLCDSQNEIRYLYLMGKRDGKIFFFLDTQPQRFNGSPKTLALPGEPYGDVPKEVWRVFASGRPLMAGPYSDRWGTFISQYVSIHDFETKKIVAVLGMDVDPVQWDRTVARQRLAPIFIVLCFVAILIVSLVYMDERKRSEIVLSESEVKYHQLVEKLNDGILTTDLAGRVIFANQGMARMLGCGVRDLAGQPHFSFLAADDIGLAKEKLRKLQQGSSEKYEIRLIRKDGKEVYAAVSSLPLHDRLEKVTGVLSIYSDMTERIKAEAVIRQMAAIVESSDDAIVGKTLQGIVVSWNAGAKKIYGYTAEEMKGFSIARLIPPDRRDEMAHFLEAMKAGKSIERFETVRITKDGRLIQVALTLSPVRDSGGNVVGTSAIARDITAQKLAEQAIRESEAKFRSITVSAQDAIIMMDNEGRVSFWNPAAEKIFGYQAGEIIGKSLHGILAPARFHGAFEGAFPHWRKTGEGGAVGKTLELTAVHKGGREIQVELSLSSVFLNDRWQSIGILRDISERKSGEAQLKKMATELTRSNQELEQFAYVASHDLQEPLRKINSFSKLIVEKETSGVDEESRDYLRRMQSAASRMSLLIDDLLQYSRVTTQAKTFESIPLRAVVEDVLGDLELRIRDARATIDLGELPVVYADKIWMRQLFQNLIGNALKYRKKDIPARVVIKSRRTDDGDNEITVQDNGIGFDEKYKERIFGAFQRLHTRDEYEGTGIGLAICKKIVEQLGGEITAKSQPGVGSEFIFKLPQG